MIPRKLMYLADIEGLHTHFISDIIDNDRYLRFGYNPTDDTIKSYIDGSFGNYGTKNMWFIIVDDCNKVVASCHVAYNSETKTAELGFTVSKHCREKGYGQELFSRGATWATARGAESLYTHCLSENKIMQHIARKNGMTVVTIDQGEKEATVKVSKRPLDSMFTDKVLDNLAIFDKLIHDQEFFVKRFMGLK